MIGLMFLLSPFIALTSQRWPHFRRVSMVFGLALVTAALVAAAFCESVSGLIGSLGVVYALGASIAYFPCFSFIDEWLVNL